MKDFEVRSSGNDDRVALLHELIEALTALGNYLAAAQRELENQPALKQKVFERVICHSLIQYDRAVEAIRQLQTLS